jgi:hypothetical protein
MLTLLPSTALTLIDTLDAFEVDATAELSTNKILASLMSGEVNTNLHSATHVELVGFKLSGNGESS